jgi:hypothetical protein
LYIFSSSIFFLCFFMFYLIHIESYIF